MECYDSVWFYLPLHWLLQYRMFNIRFYAKFMFTQVCLFNNSNIFLSSHIGASHDSGLCSVNHEHNFTICMHLRLIILSLIQLDLKVWWHSHIQFIFSLYLEPCCHCHHIKCVLPYPFMTDPLHAACKFLHCVKYSSKNLSICSEIFNQCMTIYLVYIFFSDQYPFTHYLAGSFVVRIKAW